LRGKGRDTACVSHARAAAPERLSPHAGGHRVWGAATPAPLEQARLGERKSRDVCACVPDPETNRGVCREGQGRGTACVRHARAVASARALHTWEGVLWALPRPRRLRKRRGGGGGAGGGGRRGGGAPLCDGESEASGQETSAVSLGPDAFTLVHLKCVCVCLRVPRERFGLPVELSLSLAATRSHSPVCACTGRFVCVCRSIVLRVGYHAHAPRPCSAADRPPESPRLYGYFKCCDVSCMMYGRPESVCTRDAHD